MVNRVLNVKKLGKNNYDFVIFLLFLDVFTMKFYFLLGLYNKNDINIFLFLKITIAKLGLLGYNITVKHV